mmetsp:Transcript_7721/g.24441  ORF Transcript_7721/g.24441 Transcript_7721/m.24441 type:complete len:94 (-) Transcript_7721:118-399(-)
MSALVMSYFGALTGSDSLSTGITLGTLLCIAETVCEDDVRTARVNFPRARRARSAIDISSLSQFIQANTERRRLNLREIWASRLKFYFRCSDR